MTRRRFLKRSDSDYTRTSAVDSPAKNTQARHRQSLWYNRLALLLLLLTPVVLVCYLLIFVMPQFPLNPFPPHALALATQAPTLTPQPTYTPTRTATPTATPTSTPRPTFTPTFTATPRVSAPITGTVRSGTRTPTLPPSPTNGPTLSPFNYTAEVLYQRAQLYGVNWSGIAGLIFGLDLKHQPGIGVKAWGDEPLGSTGQLLPSGTASQYGPSGWQFTLGDKPVSGKYYVQLLGSSGEPISPIVEIELKGDPRANLAYIIFRQNH